MTGASELHIGRTNAEQPLLDRRQGVDNEAEAHQALALSSIRRMTRLTKV